MTVTPCTQFIDRDSFRSNYNIGISCDYTILQLRLSEFTTPEEFDQGEKAIEKNNGTKPLSLSFYARQMELATRSGYAILIQHIYKKNTRLLDLGDRIGKTFLFKAVCNEKLQAVEALLELGANPNISTIKPVKFEHYPSIVGVTALWAGIEIYNMRLLQSDTHPTILANDKAIIKLLLKYGAVAAPGLAQDRQLLLKQVQASLDKDRTELATAMDCATAGAFPKALLPTIVEYV